MFDVPKIRIKINMEIDGFHMQQQHWEMIFLTLGGRIQNMLMIMEKD